MTDEPQTSPSHRYAVVVAGGSGTRLWPLSRKDLPKQLQKLVSDRTLLEETISRLKGVLPESNIFVSTTMNICEKMKQIIPEIPDENYIVEPVARGTTAAFALFTRTIQERDPDAIIFSLASDHAVTHVGSFKKAIIKSFEFIEHTKDTIAIVGIKPDRPDTGLGYIKVDKIHPADPTIFSAEKFVEKPSFKVARSYVDSGEYYWNSAYYCFKAQTLIDAYNDADPIIMRHIDTFLHTKDESEYLQVPEKAHEIEFINSTLFPLAIIPADFKWSDIGNWYSLHKLLSDLSGSVAVTNMVNGDHVDVNSTDYLIYSTEKKLIATAGLSNIAIIATPDVLLILNKNKSSDVKKLIKSIKEEGLDKYL